MIWLFYIVTIFGLYIFMFKEREFDLFTIGFFSSIIYFFPGYLGYVMEPVLYRDVIKLAKVNIIDETYYVMILVLLSVVLFGILNDILLEKASFSNRIFTQSIQEAIHITPVLVIISFLSFVLILIYKEASLFSGKTIVWSGSSLGLLKIIWSISISYIFVEGTILKRRGLLLYSGVLLIILFLTGDRTVLTIIFLTILLYNFKLHNKQRLINKINLSSTITIFIFGFLIIIGKRIYGSFQHSGIQGVFEVVLDKDVYLNGVLNSEPFAVQNILNKVLLSDFYMGMEYLSDLPIQLLPIPSIFGVESQKFSMLFTDTFYSFVDYGMAYNFWAEAYGVGKWGGIILFIILYNILILTFNFFINIKDVHLKTLFLLLGTYWAFYIHRNSIYTILTFERHHIYIYIISLALSFFLYIVFNSKLTRGLINE